MFVRILVFFAFIMLHSMPASAQVFKATVPPNQPPTLPHYFGYETVRSRVIKSLEDNQKGSISSKHAFAKSIAGYPTHYYVTGEVITEWSDWNDLLQKHANAFLESIDDTTVFNVMITRDPEINAYATAGGYMFFNLGMLAESDRFEELLMVMGHEIGHNLSDHAWQGYLDRERAMNQVLVSSFFGGVIGLVGRAAAYSAYLNHSREDESEADDHAINFMNKRGYDLAKGVEFYQKIILQRKNWEVKYGYKGSHWFYGSTHPEPEQRYQKIKAMAIEPTNDPTPANFHSLRQRARYERLHILNARGQYRDAIESAWRYGFENPENDTIQLLMFDAVRRYLLVNPTDADKHVLTHDYRIAEEAKTLIHQSEIDNPIVSSALKGLLLVDDLSESPYSYGVTFQELYDILIEKAKSSPNPEAKLLLAISTPQVDGNLLNEYIQSEGIYTDYAKGLLNRKVRPKNLLLVPNHFEIYEPYATTPMSYSEVMDSYNWDKVLKIYRDEGLEGQLIRKDKIGYESPFIYDIIFRLESFALQYEESTDAVDCALLDPELGSYLMDNDIGKFVSVSVYLGHSLIMKNYRKASLTELDINSNSQIKTSSGPAIGWPGEDLMANHFSKRHRKLK